jgi:hypothetical protein
MDRDAFKGGEYPESSLPLGPTWHGCPTGSRPRRGAVQPAQATVHPRSCLLEVLNRASGTAAAICATRGPRTAPAWAILAWIVAVDSCTWYRSGSTLRSTHNNNGYCVNTATPRPLDRRLIGDGPRDLLGKAAHVPLAHAPCPLESPMLGDLRADRGEVNLLSPLLGQLRRFGREPCPAPHRTHPAREGRMLTSGSATSCPRAPVDRWVCGRSIGAAIEASSRSRPRTGVCR